jgi:YggT family protein
MNAILFLIQTVFQLYILLVMLRFLFQLVRADFYNPLSQFIVRVTNPPLVLLRRVIPGVGGVDVGAIVLMLLLTVLQFWVMLSLIDSSFSIIGLVSMAAINLILLAINVFFYTVLILVILSWVNPDGHNPIIGVLHSLAEPLLAPVRRAVPMISGFDLSPLIVAIALRMLALLVSDAFLATGLAGGASGLI